MEYIFSAVKVCSNPCVGPFPRTNMYFFLLSIVQKKLRSTPKTNSFGPNQSPGNENLDLVSNPIP